VAVGQLVSHRQGQVASDVEAQDTPPAAPHDRRHEIAGRHPSPGGQIPDLDPGYAAPVFRPHLTVGLQFQPLQVPPEEAQGYEAVNLRGQK
jgi:hypothetical protein